LHRGLPGKRGTQGDGHSPSYLTEIDRGPATISDETRWMGQRDTKVRDKSVPHFPSSFPSPRDHPLRRARTRRAPVATLTCTSVLSRRGDFYFFAAQFAAVTICCNLLLARKNVRSLLRDELHSARVNRLSIIVRRERFIES